MAKRRRSNSGFPYLSFPWKMRGGFMRRLMFICALVMLILFQLSCIAFADLTLDFESLTDAELQYILNGANSEIERRSTVSTMDESSGQFIISDYAEFDYKSLYRNPSEHIGEKYMISGDITISLGGGNSMDGYEGVWLHYQGDGSQSEYVLSLIHI